MIIVILIILLIASNADWRNIINHIAVYAEKLLLRIQSLRNHQSIILWCAVQSVNYGAMFIAQLLHILNIRYFYFQLMFVENA